MTQKTSAGLKSFGQEQSWSEVLRQGFAHIADSCAFNNGDETLAGVKTFGSMFRIPINSDVAATGSTRDDAAALSYGFTLVTGADDTKGVVLPTAVAGGICIIKVGTGADLKVYPAADAAINALSADAAITVVDDVCFIFIAKSATQWYTLPLLPS